MRRSQRSPGTSNGVVRALGAFIVACGVAVCYGALQLWPANLAEAPHAWSLIAVDVLRIVAAGIVAFVGAGNILAGLAVLLLKPVRA